MFNLAIDNGLYDKNPIEKIKKYREDNFKVRYLETDEEERLFIAIDELFPYLRPIVKCALYTGMRKSEILKLQWSQIDFKYKFIEVLASKSGKSRKIPISTKLFKILTCLKNNNNKYVFVNPKTVTAYKDIKKSFNIVTKKANVLNFRFHDLRHTATTRMAAKMPIPVLQEILGHAKISTTMRYAHVMPAQKRKAIEVLDSYD